MYPNQPIRVRVSVCPCPSVKVSVWKRKTMPQNNWLRFWSLLGRFLRPVRRLGWFFFGFCVRFWSSFTCAVTDMMRKLPGKIDKRQNLALLACKWAADPTANQRQEWQADHSNVHLSFSFWHSTQRIQNNDNHWSNFLAPASSVGARNNERDCYCSLWRPLPAGWRPRLNPPRFQTPLS